MKSSRISTAVWTPEILHSAGWPARPNYAVAYPALVAQGIEHRFPKPCAAGSNPAEGTFVISQDIGTPEPASGRREDDDEPVKKQETGARLTAARDATLERITAMTADLAAVAAASVGSNLDDEHDPEGSTIAFEREQLAALRAHAQAHLTEVDAALTRLHDDRFGRCEVCDRPIGNARLEALPATRLCVACAARSNR